MTKRYNLVQFLSEDKSGDLVQWGDAEEAFEALELIKKIRSFINPNPSAVEFEEFGIRLLADSDVGKNN
jgi:hypothetical protein